MQMQLLSPNWTLQFKGNAHDDEQLVTLGGAADVLTLDKRF
jgi:hypothetical protein